MNVLLKDSNFVEIDDGLQGFQKPDEFQFVRTYLFGDYVFSEYTHIIIIIIIIIIKHFNFLVFYV
jgi:hypothetical protein